MSTDKGIHISSDRQKWAKILSTLVHMVQTQKIQLESMGKERKLLEDRTKILYDRWVSDVRLSEDQISQMKSDFMLEELKCSLDMAKSDFVVGLKQREALLYKMKLGHAGNELADFKVCFDNLSQKCSNPKDICGGNSIEISSLARELAPELRSKHVQFEQSNEKIEKLLASMEQLQSLNNEKDVTIVALKTKLAKMEADTDKRNEEIFSLSRELELLRKSGQ